MTPTPRSPSLRRALYVDPTFGLAAFQLGRAHEELGDRAAAARAYEQALRTLEPEDARHELILDQVDLGDVAAACAIRLKALRGSAAMKILIVDDSPTPRLILRRELEGLGHECIVAEDGNEALEMFRSFGAGRRRQRLDDARHGRRRALPPGPVGSVGALRLLHPAHLARRPRLRRQGDGGRRGRLPDQDASSAPTSRHGSSPPSG